MQQDPEVKALEYVEMSLPQLQALDRATTVFLVSVSPIEVHGPHLPVGTDVFVAEHLLNRYIRELARRRPDLTFVKLPPLFTGADALPVAGSLSVPAAHVEGVLKAYGKGLARQGFKYLFVADNHGGPRHQMAIVAAARALWKRHRFYLVDPFGLEFKHMVQHDAAFMNKTGLGPGACGDDSDSHAGTNETSLMLACSPSRVDPRYAEIPASLPPPARGMALFVKRLGKLIWAFGGVRFGRDLNHLANTLAWVNDPNMKPYMGNPSAASQEAGEAMLAARVEVAVELFEKALGSAGREPVHIVPMLWSLRVMRRLPE